MNRALVIDDDVFQALFVRTILEKGGWQVDVAEDGRAGIARLRQDRYDLVIADIVTPDQKGIETIHMVRSQFPEVRIIAMSAGNGGGTDDDLHFARAFGADQTIRKPFTPAALLKRMESAMAPRCDFRVETGLPANGRGVPPS